MLFLWKKEPAVEKEETTSEEEVDLSDIKISF